MSTQETRLREIADAIRAKEGSTEPIPANAFARRILALEMSTQPEGVCTISLQASDPDCGIVTGGGFVSEGMTVTVEATIKEGYRFIAWQENGITVNTSIAYSFAVTGDRSLTAVVETIVYTITAFVEQSCTGTVTGFGVYQAGKTATIIATPNAGYYFTGWQENGVFVSTSALYSFTVTGDRTLTAVFSVSAPEWGMTTLPGSSESWDGITYGNGKFVAVASRSKNIACSTDGITWEVEARLSSYLYWRCIAFGDGVFVATADQNSNIAAYSKDGIAWEQTTLSEAGNWYGATYGNGKFVTVNTSSYYAAYSTDGITWVKSYSLPRSAGWRSVTFGDGKFVAVSYNSSVAAYSVDGINWKSATLPYVATWRSITYGKGKFVAVSYNTQHIAYSTDGITWKGAIPSYIRGVICFGNDRFVAIPYGRTSDKAAYSSDGINWEEITLPISQYYNCIAYGNGRFVLLGSSQNVVYSI